MEQKRIKVRLTENSPYSDYGYYEKGDIGYIDGYVNDNAVIILENGKFAKADLRWIEVVNEEDKNVNTELRESEDEKIRKELIEYIRKTTCVNFIGKCSQKEAEKFISWLEKQAEQKSVEWSANDLPEFDSYLCLMFQKFRTKGVCTNGEIVDFVKEHSQKLKDTLCHAWSEEDEAVLDALIRRIEGEDIYVSPHLAVECLKSLKEGVQPQPQSQWKPSDEQIEALSHMIDAVEDEWACEEPVGRELLKQLKKLRGE